MTLEQVATALVGIRGGRRMSTLARMSTARRLTTDCLRRLAHRNPLRTQTAACDGQIFSTSSALHCQLATAVLVFEF
eukprot:COSAG05_NODE_2727_length_2722_cov_13.450904_2_plen_77_part_00